METIVQSLEKADADVRFALAQQETKRALEYCELVWLQNKYSDMTDKANVNYKIESVADIRDEKRDRYKKLDKITGLLERARHLLRSTLSDSELKQAQKVLASAEKNPCAE